MSRIFGFGSLRSRLTLLATIVVAVVLTSTAVALVVIQQRQLTANLDATLDQRADTLAAGFTRELPSADLVTDDEDRAIQLVDSRGTVIAASGNLEGEPALVDELGPETTEVVVTRSDLPLEDDAYRVLSRRIDTVAGAAVLHVAENVDDLADTQANLRTALAVIVPLVVVLLAALMWWLTGLTLAPVDRIRSEVDAIDDASAGHRVHAPDNDDEVDRLARTMNRMLDRLDRSADRQRRFVADAAHELRTPLTRIRTEVEVDLAQPDRADPLATNDRVRSEIIGLQELIDDLLHLARADSGPPGVDHRPIDLDDIVLAEIRRQRVTAEPAIDASGVSAAHLDGNPDHLARVVRNLLTNATRHARTTVTVTLDEHNDTIELAVADDGLGVAPEHRDRIFDRFARIDDARARVDGGTGLGLAITRDIVERHGGTIDYDSAWTDGARFTVLLPRHRTEPT